MLENGTHDELVEREGGAYAALWNAQAHEDPLVLTPSPSGNDLASPSSKEPYTWSSAAASLFST